MDGGDVLFLLYRTTEQPWNEERWNEVREARDLALVTQSTALPTLGFLASIDSADQNKGGGQSLPTSSVVVTYLCAVQITGLKEIINWEAVTGAYCSAQCVASYHLSRNGGSDKSWQISIINTSSSGYFLRVLVFC